MHQEVGAGCPGSLDGLPELLVSELKLTQAHQDTRSDKDTNTQSDTNIHSYAACMLFVFQCLMAAMHHIQKRCFLAAFGTKWIA